MRQVIKPLQLALVLSIFPVSGCLDSKKETELKTDTQKYSYAIGQQIGRGIKSRGVEVDVDTIAMSLRDALAGKESRLSESEMRDAMMSIRRQMNAKKEKEAQENKKKGDAFLAQNKGKSGVKVTKSGLQYEVMKAGSGKKPKSTDRVKVHYKGTLINGTEFDSSYARNKPAEFPVTGVIKGWVEALQMMPVGSKWKLAIPSELAYGSRGRPKIPANSVLVFEVELLEILASKAKKPNFKKK